MSVTLPTQTLLPGQSVTLSLPNPSLVQALKVSNKSFYDMQYSGFGTIGLDWIASGTEYMLYSSIYNKGEITLSAFNNASISNPTAGPVLITQYDVSEELPKGIWPISIPFQNVQVNTVSQALSVVNDGNVSGTTIVEATVSGEPASSVVLLNNGTLRLGDKNIGGEIDFVDTGGSNRPFAYRGSNNSNIILAHPNDATLHIGNSALNADIAKFNDTSGFTLLLGTLNLLLGSISKIAKAGPYSVTTTAAAFNHNLGVVPDFVIITIGGTSSVAISCTANFSTMTTTQVTLQASGSLSNIFLLSVKF